jgi:hypothetical protein
MTRKSSRRIFADMKKRVVSYAPKVDIEDGSKPHELDPPHIVEALEEEHINKEEYGILAFDDPRRDAQEAIRNPVAPFTSDDTREHTITQQRIDAVRLRVLPFSILGAIRKKHIGVMNIPPIRHFWFGANDDRVYELRMGNPPPDSSRPSWLKGMKLEQDLGVITPEVAQAFMDKLNGYKEEAEDNRLIQRPGNMII